MTGLRKLATIAALAAALAAPAAAQAGVYGDYSSDGSIDGCDYSGSELQNAAGSIPTDVAQYDPRFKDALNKALAQRAAGCGGGETAAEQSQKTAAAAADGSPKPPAPTAVPGQLAGDTDLDSEHGFPAALAVLAGMVALIILGTALVAWRSETRLRTGRAGFFAFFTDYYWGIRDTIGR